MNWTPQQALGEGAFGKVMQASASDIVNSGENTTVAVKMLKEGHTDQVFVPDNFARNMPDAFHGWCNRNLIIIQRDAPFKGFNAFHAMRRLNEPEHERFTRRK